jgi:hypothetical protein
MHYVKHIYSITLSKDGPSQDGPFLLPKFASAWEFESLKLLQSSHCPRQQFRHTDALTLFIRLYPFGKFRFDLYCDGPISFLIVPPFYCRAGMRFSRLIQKISLPKKRRGGGNAAPFF